MKRVSRPSAKTRRAPILRTLLRAALLLPVLLPAAGLPAGCTRSEREASTLRLGYLKSDLHQLAVFVAMDKGFFEDEGLAVSVTGVFKAGPELMSAFAAGELDVGYAGLAPTVTAAANAATKIRVLAQVNREGSALVVRREATWKGIEEMAGRTIAVPGLSTMQDFLLRRAIDAAGLDPMGLKILVIKPPEMAAALGRGDVDGFVAWEPFVAQALETGVGRVLIPSGRIAPGHPCCVLVARRTLVEAHPATAAALVSAHERATTFIRDNPREAILAAVAFTGLDQGTVKRAMENIVFDTGLPRESVRTYVTFLNRLGYTSVRDVNGFVDLLVGKELGH